MADAILLLAGGAASRLPGKLERSVGGKPLIVHVFDNLRSAGWPIFIAAARPFAPGIASALDSPVIYDAAPMRGPLRALLDASAQIDARHIFAVAGDLPHIEASVLQRLVAAWRFGDEAVVPQHESGVEPLAALYDRHALRRAARGLSACHDAMRDLLATLRVRYEPMDARYFTNVNTEDDLQRAGITA